MNGIPYTREDIERYNFKPLPHETYNVQHKSIEQLQIESRIWNLRPIDWCKACGGKGHIEIQCGTKKNLDREAKNMSPTQ